MILTIVNILFPPAAVYALCGIGLDLALNCVFFILAIIPSHIHGFYITCTYFHRRRKVRKNAFRELASQLTYGRSKRANTPVARKH